MLADYLRAVDRADAAMATVRTAAKKTDIAMPESSTKRNLNCSSRACLEDASSDKRLRELVQTQVTGSRA